MLTHDAIAQRAYDLYVRKGRQQGQCQDNWHQAEQDLRQHQAATGASQRRGAATATRASNPSGAR